MKKMMIVAISILALVALVFVLVPKDGEKSGEEVDGTETPSQNDDVSEDEVSEDGTSTDEKDAEKDETVIYQEGEEEEENMDFKGKDPVLDGTREPAEKKLDDYSHLMDEEPVRFKPVWPDYIAERKIQPEKIEDYSSYSVRDRLELMEMIELTKEEERELEKIIAVNKEIEEAFAEADYNKFLRNLHKDYRLEYGVTMMSLLEKGRFEEEDIAFFPEVIDVELGYAYGVSFKKLTYIEDGSRKEPKWTDGIIIYKQDAAGRWEIYYEVPFGS